MIAPWLSPGPARGGEVPEVVRVRVPSEKISEWFPPGTELQGLPADEFEALVTAARAGDRGQSHRDTPRLLRARHFARWEPADGLLLGRSELVVESAAAGPSELILSPWTPALEPSPVLRALADGRTAIAIDSDQDQDPSETRTVKLRWQLRARPGSKGRGFTLGLPATETARLELDLPGGWVPEGPQGIRQRPAPDEGASSGRATWRFDGPGGAIDLQLRDQAEGRDPHRDARIWISGPTRIDLHETAANWTTEWTVDAGARGPRQFAVLLDPGLALIDVTGPGVDEYRAEGAEGATRVTIRLARDVDVPTPVTILAVARVPTEGAWTIPAARPLDALWTGGLTTVRLDASRVLQDCRERAGRRVIPPPAVAPAAATTPVDPTLLVFEASAPEPVAALVFRKPWADVSADVRGRLSLGGAAPRLEARITWQVHRGRLLDLDVDLPPTWVPDRVAIAGVDELLAWHPEVQPGGGVRIRVIPPTSASSRSPLAMTVEATANVAGGRGPLALPRVRPARAGSGVRVGDELWIATTDPTLALRPTSARGLAWVDPRIVAAALAVDEAAEGETAGDPLGQAEDALRGALAWRWINDRAEARVERGRVESEPRGTVDLRAVVDRDRVRYDGRIAIESGGETLESIPLGVREDEDEPSGTGGDSAPTLDDWHFHDEATGLELVRRPLDERRRVALGLPDSGSGRAWELLLPHPRRGSLTIRARLERPWPGRGVLPLLVLPGRLHTRGTVVVEVDRNVRSTVEATGLRSLDPSIAGRDLEIAAQSDPAEPPAPGPATATHRLAHAFAYSSGNGNGNGQGQGRLVLRTEDLKPAPAPGVIREAVLTTRIQPGDARRHHLTLRISAERASALDLTLPDGALLARVRRDGQAVVPNVEGRGLTIPLDPQRASRSSCTVTLDYLTEHDPNLNAGAGGTTLRPDRPRSSFPCLSFCWEIVAPDPWVVTDPAPGLMATDPAAGSATAWGRPLGWSRLWEEAARAFRKERAATPEAAALAALDARVSATRPDEVTLGEWFTRWDSGTSPLIVDRLALATAGWGPRSRIIPPRSAPGRPGAARAALRPLGLSVVPLGGLLLITTAAESPARRGGPLGRPGGRESWESVLREAAAWGSDPSDRFQAITRWRGAPTPRGPLLADSEFDSPEPLAEGWRCWRFVAPGWPAPGASVHLVDAGRRSAAAWALGLAVLFAGIVARRLPAARRATLLAATSAVLVLALAARPSRESAYFTGGLAGAAAVALYWLGATIPVRTRPRSRESIGGAPSGSRLRNLGITTALLVTVGAALSGLASQRAGAQIENENVATTPILALFPYDGPADPGRPPDRALLRWTDAERLRALAAAGRDRADASSSVRALEATHRVSWVEGEGRVARVETSLTLSRGAGPSPSWTFPVGDAREIVATIDGRSAPVQVRDEGRTGVVLLDEGKDLQRLTLRRLVAPRGDSPDDLLRMAVNPVASARVEIDDDPGKTPLVVTSARGRIVPHQGEGVGTSGGIAGLLGPADRIEIRRAPEGEAAGAPVPSGTVDALLLWDAEPAGDHVRARLTYHKPGGTSQVRLALAPGLVLRPGAISGLVDAGWQGADDRPEWVASIDPPLPDGATVELEFWRPVPAPVPGSAADTPPPGRSLPRIEPMGVERYSGALAFRRPADWSGRLSAFAGAGFEPMTDEAFVKAWGNLTDEPLTLAGTLRFLRTPAVLLPTGPPPCRLQVESDIQMAIEPGRIGIDLRASLITITGRCHQVEFELPPAVRVVQVEADGLTDWSRSAEGRVRVRFDGPALDRRSLRVHAWLPAGSDPLALGVARQEAELPWPRWIDAEPRPAPLTLASPTRFQLTPSAGVTAINAPEPPPAGTPERRAGGVSPLSPEPPPAGTPYRAAYRVERPLNPGSGPGRLAWDVEPPRVEVLVESQLTVLPDFAEWVAVLRYDVAGGAAEVVHLRLPSSWAAGARLLAPGEDAPQLTTETRGPVAFWKIRPEHPIWGSQRLVIRAAVPLPATGELEFPDLVPLGRGAVDTYIALVDASGRNVVPEGSPGLQPIVSDDRFRAEVFAGPRGVTPSLFHVRREGWTLKVQWPVGAVADAAGSGLDEARVALADLACTLNRDGSALGLASYEVEPRSGPFLTITPPSPDPDQSEPLWAAVNHVSAPPLRGASGQWLIPLGEPSDRPAQVRLIWKSAPAPASRPDALRTLLLPTLARPGVPTFVTVSAPEDIALASPKGTLERVSRERLEVGRVEWQGRRTAAALGTLDRSSQRDCEELVAQLVRFELLARDAARAAFWGVGSPSAFPEVYARRLQDRTRTARESLATAIQNTALDELSLAAQIHLGLVADDPNSSPLDVPEPDAGVRIRRLGPPRYFESEPAADSQSLALSWTLLPPRPSLALAPPWPWSLLSLLLLLLIVSAFTLRTVTRAATTTPLPWLGPAFLSLTLLILALATGPLPLAAGLALACLGWTTARSESALQPP